MKSMKEPLTCPICGEGRLHVEETNVTISVGKVKVDVPRSLHWCDACGTEMATSDDARFNARVARSAEQRALGRLTGTDIHELRKELGITQETAGKIFGGGPIAFCKYEKDDLSPSDAMDNLLWMVKRFPKLAEYLADRNGVEIRREKKEEIQTFVFERSEICNEHSRELFDTISSAIANSHRSWAHGSLRSSGSLEAANQQVISLEPLAA